MAATERNEARQEKIDQKRIIRASISDLGFHSPQKVSILRILSLLRLLKEFNKIELQNIFQKRYFAENIIYFDSFTLIGYMLAVMIYNKCCTEENKLEIFKNLESIINRLDTKILTQEAITYYTHTNRDGSKGGRQQGSLARYVNHLPPAMLLVCFQKGWIPIINHNIKELDVVKKKLVLAIKGLPDNREKIEIIKKCLDKKTSLGKLCHLARYPFTKTSREKGALKELSDEMVKVNGVLGSQLSREQADAPSLLY